MIQKGITEISRRNNDMAIIFVHGLSGHPLKTWTKAGERSFPHLLSEDEECRGFDIYTFGYETNFIFKKHHFKIIADILLTEIKANFKEYNSLIFITHSMGGIIVQSLITQILEDRNQDLMDKVAGIVYLAVPFFGSKIASSFTLISRLVLPQFLLERFVSVQVLSLKAFSHELSDLSNRWGQYSRQGLLNFEELNLYGHSDKTVSTEFAKVAHISNPMGVDETHISICKVDRNSTVYTHVKQFLQKISVKKKVVPKHELNNYKKWLIEKTKDFYVPRVNIPLSIEKALASVYVLEELKSAESTSLEEAILNYHEWARLSMNHQKKKSGQDVLIAEKKVVVIGGPGSGKSTLAQKIVNKIVKQDKKVLYFKFSFLANLMAQGRTFDEALWNVALDGYSGDKEELKRLFQSVDVVIGDGLDESGKNMDFIVRSFKNWLIGRENTKVIVTTRPIGHNPAQFQEFSYFEILPLDIKEIEGYSKTLLELLEHENSEVLHEQFLDKIRKNKMVNFASRSPLLLNFLILLLVSGKEFGNYRSELYGKILNEWVSDSERVKNHKIGLDLAIKSIEWTGWIVQKSLEEENGVKEEQLVEKLAEFIKEELNETTLNSKEKARECLSYWEDLGLLEKIEIGYEVGYTFIHMSLGEFLAAKHLNTFNEKEKKEFLISKIHKPVWREPFLLCAGLGSSKVFIETILHMKDSEDFYNDISFATAMLLESSQDKDLIYRVSTEALGLLQSPIPLLSIETGKSLIEIANYDPNWMRELVEPLLIHVQLWTQLMAYKVIFATNTLQIDEKLVDKLLNLEPNHDIRWPNLLPSPLWVEWNSAVEEIIIKILDNSLMNGAELESIFMKLKERNFNARLHMNISKKLEDLNEKHLLDLFNERIKPIFNMESFGERIKKIRKSESKMLELIIANFETTNIKSKHTYEPLVEFSKFVKALGILEQQLNEIYFLMSTDLDVVVEVFKATILAYDLDKNFIYLDAKLLMDKLEGESSFIYKLLDSSELDIINTDLEKEIDTEKVIRGILHPSETIKINSTLILANLDPSEALISQLKEKFLEVKGQCLRYFSIILSYWLDDSFDLFMKKINTNHEGVQYIFEYLPKPVDPKKLKELETILIKMLNSKNEDIVFHTTKAIKKLTLSSLNEEVLKVLFYWDGEGAMCDKHNIRTNNSSCPKCSVVPRTVASSLIELIIESDNFTFEQRVLFAQHKNSYVNAEGKKALTYYLNLNTEYIYKIVQKIVAEINMGNLFDSLINVNHEILELYLNEIVLIYNSKEIIVRQKLIKELSKRNFGNKELIKTILTNALEDSAVQVRDEALKAYRLLEL